MLAVLHVGIQETENHFHSSAMKEIFINIFHKALGLLSARVHRLLLQ